MDEAQQQRDELITIAGGVEMEVAYLDGTKETVKVRQIPISKFNSFIMSLSNEAKSIELYCNKDNGWADSLALESANAILDKGQELNLPFLSAWFRRQAKWKQQGPDLGATVDSGKKTQVLEPPGGQPLADSVAPLPASTT